MIYKMGYDYNYLQASIYKKDKMPSLGKALGLGWSECQLNDAENGK
jgi:hypothetical protein